MTAACIGEPISWPRLERHAVAPEREVAEHVATCAACRACLQVILDDTGALPALPVPIGEARRRPRTRLAIGAAVAVAAAAAIALVVVRPDPDVRADRFAIKGGELVVGLVRERAGAIADDATTFRAGDRWKVVVTCPPGATLDTLITSVTEVTAGSGDAARADHPLAPARVACGNRVALPGAFALTGARANRVCVALADRRACLTVTPE